MEQLNILVISGGNRVESFNTKVAKALVTLAPEGTQLTLADITKLPLYNQDLEENYPAEAASLKEQIRAADGIIFVTPEYNRSIPTALKNALDWASRPYGESAWNGKPVMITGATPGGTGTTQAQAHLRQIVTYLNMRILGQPEIYLSHVADLLAEDGSIADESTRELLSGALATFAEFVTKLK